jgi:cell division protein ZapD
MNHTATPAPEAQPAQHPDNSWVVYEQPLNERMRTFLRLDFLYSQALYHNETSNVWSSRAAVASLLEILAITARGDVRNEVLKELERQIHGLNVYQSKPGVDAGRLRAVLSNLMRLRNDLNGLGASYVQPLRDSEFLNAVKHRSAIPGGTCEFDLPDYFHWLNRAGDARIHDFNDWLSLVRPLCDSIAELLWVIRANARQKREVAPGGVFQINFERENPCQLLRIALPESSSLYPEISGSHYRCSVRFLSWRDAFNRPTQAQDDVSFVLTCCY